MRLLVRFTHPLVAVALLLAATLVHAADFGIVKRFDVPGAGGWDYLQYDADRGRLFITRADRVQVVDAKDGHLVGEIPDTPGVHGVALASRLGKGFTSNGRGNSITVFDLATLATTKTIPIPDARNPDFILYDDATTLVVTFNGGSANATIVDAATERVVRTVPLPGRPESAAVDGKGRAYVALEDKDVIAIIDLPAGRVIGTIALPGCDEPAAVAIDRQERRLFVGCHNRTMDVVAIDRAATIATLAIGSGVDAATFDPGSRLAFTSQGDGTLTVVRETSTDRFEVVQNVVTIAGARTMALDPNGPSIYVVSADFDEAPAVPGQARPRRTVRPGTLKLYRIAAGDH